VAGNLISCDFDTYRIYIHDGISSTILSSFIVSSGDWRPTGLAFDGANLISCITNIVAGGGKIYIHDGVSSTILSSFSSPDTAPQGLTFNGANLISCDYGADKIYIHDGVSSTILSSFSSPSTFPQGLAFDGTNLISCDYDTKKIYIHDGVSSTILSSFSSPDTAPRELAFDGTNLISCDSYIDKIYIHDGVSSTILSSFPSPGSRPYGLTIAPITKPSKPTNLKCEGAANPEGITDRNPELTATYSHIYGYDGRYYRVQVSRTSNFSDIVWDSGKKRLITDISKGDTCQPITVGQTLPLDGSKYYWRIKFWDVNDNEGDWSTE